MTTINSQFTTGIQIKKILTRSGIDPSAYLASIRKVHTAIEIDFPEGTQVYYDDQIYDLSILKEATSIGDNPLGFISANSINISLDNSRHIFTPRDLSSYHFYGGPEYIFDGNPNTSWKFTGDFFEIYDHHWQTGNTYEEIAEKSFFADKLVIKSNSPETITFTDYFRLEMYGWWWYYYVNLHPMTFTPYEEKVIDITPTAYSGGSEFPKLFYGFWMMASIDWETNFTFLIQEIEALDEDGNNNITLPSDPDLNNSYFYPEEHYVDPDEPKKVRPGLKLRPYVKIGTHDQESDWKPLGTFWSGEWETPSDSMEARTTGYDRLMSIISMDTPQIPPMVNTTIGQMFGRLFRAIGLEIDEYIISPALKQYIKVGWFTRDTVGQSLQRLAEAGNCYVTTNANNQIVVYPNERSLAPDVLLTDENSLYSISNPQRFLDTYPAVKVIYILPYLKPVDPDLVILNDIFIPRNSVTALDRVDFKADDIPVMQINQIYLHGDFNLPEKQTLSFGTTTEGTFLLGEADDPEDPTWSSAITYSSNAETLTANIQSALDSLYGSGKVQISLKSGVYTLTFNLDVEVSYLIADFDNLTYSNVDNPALLTLQQPFAPPMNSILTDVSFGATDITMVVTNDSDFDEYINVRIKGIGTGRHDSHRIAINQELVEQFGYKELTIENSLIQDRVTALNYSNLILDYVSDPLSVFTFEVMINPDIEVGENIQIESIRNFIEVTNVTIRRILHRFTDVAKSVIEARRR